VADMLATPEDLAALLQQDLDRATAELLIECATAVVQSAAGGQRILQVVNDVETLYLDEYDGGTWLVLPQRPVTAVSAVSIGATSVTDWSPQLNRSRLFRGDGWRSTLVAYPDAPSTVTVTYTHGFPDGDQRLQLARSATLALAAQGYSNPGGALREQIDDYAVQYTEMSARMEATPQLIQTLRQRYGLAGKSVRLVAS
jgi:hypothetical protein